MSRIPPWFSAIALVLVFAAPNGRAADLPALGTVVVAGEVKTPLALSAAELAALPSVEVDVSFLTDHGEEHARYKGVLLAQILERAMVVDGPEKGARLRHAIRVTGRDGYTVVLAMGEIDPKFEGKSVIIAYEKDGKPLSAADGLRLVVPLDHHGGRAVRDVAAIEVN